MKDIHLVICNGREEYWLENKINDFRYPIRYIKLSSYFIFREIESIRDCEFTDIMKRYDYPYTMSEYKDNDYHEIPIRISESRNADSFSGLFR